MIFRVVVTSPPLVGKNVLMVEKSFFTILLNFQIVKGATEKGLKCNKTEVFKVQKFALLFAFSVLPSTGSKLYFSKECYYIIKKERLMKNLKIRWHGAFAEWGIAIS